MRRLTLLAIFIAAFGAQAVQAAPVGSPELHYYTDPASAWPFSPAVRVGDVIYLSGQIGLDQSGKLPNGMEAQAHAAMDNVVATARRAGVGMDRIVKCTVMLSDMSQWAAFNAIYVHYSHRNTCLPDPLSGRMA